jgi:FKBP-type peptidyl-prolyl cis-trans isomerase (trigger factor)
MISQNTVTKTETLLTAVCSIAPKDYQKTEESVFRDMAKNVTLPGFREGKAPEALIRERIGAGHIMEETARRAIEEAYPTLLQNEGVRPIGDPRITITKCVSGNPIEFTVEVPLYPAITLPKYKEIAEKITAVPQEEPVVSDAEVEQTLTEIKNYRTGEKPTTETPAPEVVLDDAFAQSLGDFKNLADLKEKLKENILFEKKQKEKVALRKKILAEIIEKTKLPLPESVVDAETEGMLTELKEQISVNGLAFDDYLRHSKKTQEELMKELRIHAESRVREEFIVHEIAAKESLHPTPEEVTTHTESFKISRPEVDETTARRYVAELLLHENVHQFLEGKGPITKETNKE